MSITGAITTFTLFAGLLGDATPVPLTADERAALEKKLAEFEAIPEPERNKVLELHKAVSAQTEDGARYRKLLDDYRHWLDSLTPSQRQRIVDAATPEARIAVVRAIVGEQSRTLAQDLEPLENDRRGPNSRRGSRNFSRPPEEFLNFTKTLAPKLTENEKKKLESMSMRGRFPLMVVLATKHGVSGDGFVRDSQPFIFESAYQIVDKPIDRFGAATFGELTPENKKKFVDSVAEVMLLPDVDRRERFTFLDSQPKQVKEAIDSLSRRNPIGWQLLVNILYYKQHPDAAPEELRDSLEVFSPSQAIQRLARPSRPGDDQLDERFGPPMPPPPGSPLNGPRPGGPPPGARPPNDRSRDDGPPDRPTDKDRDRPDRPRPLGSRPMER